MKRVSPCFAYWRSNNDIFGVNIVRSKDCDRFCELFIRNFTASSSMHQHLTNLSETTKAANFNHDSETLQTIMIHDAVVQHSDNDTKHCMLQFRLRPTSIRIGNTAVPICLVRFPPSLWNSLLLYLCVLF